MKELRIERDIMDMANEHLAEHGLEFVLKEYVSGEEHLAYYLKGKPSNED